MCSIVSAVVQIFFAWRILLLAKSPILPGGIVVLAVTQAAAGITGGVMLRRLPDAAQIAGAVIPPLLIWLIGSALVDILIAITMSILLCKARTGIRRTDTIIRRIIWLTVETGTLTASFDTVDLILSSVAPMNATLDYQCLSLILTKMYANMFLTNVNSRAYMRINKPISETIAISRLNFAPDVASQEVKEGSDLYAHVPFSRDFHHVAHELSGPAERLQKPEAAHSKYDINNVLKAELNSLV